MTKNHYKQTKILKKEDILLKTTPLGEKKRNENVAKKYVFYDNFNI